jgi:hypothetical protein
LTFTLVTRRPGGVVSAGVSTVAASSSSTTSAGRGVVLAGATGRGAGPVIVLATAA